VKRLAVLVCLAPLLASAAEPRARDLGVPVVPTVARSNTGIDELLNTVAGVASGEIVGKPKRNAAVRGQGRRAIEEMTELIESALPGLSNARWVAMRLLDGDRRLEEAIHSGELVELAGQSASGEVASGAVVGTDAIAMTTAARSIVESSRALRWDLGVGFQDAVTESMYARAARIADRAVSLADTPRRFDLDRVVDNLVTSRWLGFPIMLGILKRKRLQRRISGRSTDVPQRRAERYLKHFDEIWHLQSYLLSEADRTNIPIIDNNDRDKIFREVMRITIEILARDCKHSARSVFG